METVIDNNTIIGQLVSQHHSTVKVFHKNDIDFCCGGKQSLSKACQATEINIDDLIQELNQCIQEEDKSAVNFNAWPLDLLIDYIVKKHHKYVEDNIGIIRELSVKIADVHGDRHPELIEMKEIFFRASGELASHMKKEEIVLFPYIDKLLKLQKAGEKLVSPGTIKSPISVMHSEHDAEGEYFRQMAQLSNNYTPPPGACTSYQTCFKFLKEFQDDLHMHIHLENNILFPKAIELEELVRK